MSKWTNSYACGLQGKRIAPIQSIQDNYLGMMQIFYNVEDVHEPLAGQTAICWKPPSNNYFKVNVDVTLDIARGVIGIGIVVRDHYGNFFAGKIEARIGGQDPHTAKFLAVRKGLLLA